MKTALTIGLLVAVLMACGPSTPKVEEMVATAVAESEERVAEQVRDRTAEAVAEALAGSEARLAEAVAGAVEDSESRTALAFEAVEAKIAQSICASDYITMSNYTTLWLITDHLQGGETPTEDLWAAFDDGLLPLDEVYVRLSHVCERGDDRWVLVDQPKVAAP